MGPWDNPGKSPRPRIRIGEKTFSRRPERVTEDEGEKPAGVAEDTWGGPCHSASDA